MHQELRNPRQTYLTYPHAPSSTESEAGGPHLSPTMSTKATTGSTSSMTSSATITPEASHSATTLALGVSLAVVATIVFGGLAVYFVRRHYKRKKAQEYAEELSSHRRTYMVSVDPSHLAARVTPFGVGVNAPNVEVPKFGEFLSTTRALGKGSGGVE